jgi:striatin 1/3/4
MLGSLQGFSQGGPGQQGPPQQQQQQQPGPGAGMGGGMGGIPPPPPLNGQDFTLSSVLHFLQTEWRRYERDRNEWEIERAEMRVGDLTGVHQLHYACDGGFVVSTRLMRI